MFEISATAAKRKIQTSSILIECAAVFGISYLIVLLVPLFLGAASLKSRRTNNDLINWIADTYNEPNAWMQLCIVVATISAGSYLGLLFTRKHIVTIRIDEKTIALIRRNYIGNHFHRVEIAHQNCSYNIRERAGTNQLDAKMELTVRDKSGKTYTISNFSKFWDVKKDLPKLQELKSEFEKHGLENTKS